MEKQIGSTHPHVSPTTVNQLIHPITVLLSNVSECVDLTSPQSGPRHVPAAHVWIRIWGVAFADSCRIVENSPSHH